MEMAEKDKVVSAQSVFAFVLESQNQIRDMNQKLRLLDDYLEQDIEGEIYREQKTKLLMEKKSLPFRTLRGQSRKANS